MRKFIDSTKNAEVKGLVRLKERRTRDREGRYLIEGTRELTRARAAGVPLQRLYFCRDLLRPEGHVLLEELDVERVELSREAFEHVSYRQGPDGLMVVAGMKPRNLWELTLPERALVLVIDGLEKPGNLGALLRTADGARVGAVFLTGAGTDLYNPNVIRASMGSVFNRPVLTVTPSEGQRWLAEGGFTLVATTPGAQESFWDADYTGSTAILLGAEHQGLSGGWLEAADTHVSIPMNGLTDSLNVATAGALLLYEALRQRRS